MFVIGHKTTNDYTGVLDGDFHLVVDELKHFSSCGGRGGERGRGRGREREREREKEKEKKRKRKREKERKREKSQKKRKTKLLS